MQILHQATVIILLEPTCTNCIPETNSFDRSEWKERKCNIWYRENNIGKLRHFFTTPLIPGILNKVYWLYNTALFDSKLRYSKSTKNWLRISKSQWNIKLTVKHLQSICKSLHWSKCQKRFSNVELSSAASFLAKTNNQNWLDSISLRLTIFHPGLHCCSVQPIVFYIVWPDSVFCTLGVQEIFMSSLALLFFAFNHYLIER